MWAVRAWRCGPYAIILAARKRARILNKPGRTVRAWTGGEMAGIDVGLLGFGHWGRNLARNLAALGVLRAVCDPDPVAVRRVQEQYPDVAASEDWGKLIEDPTLSALVIATPAALHFELARRALQAGKDVFVEKPLALTVKEGEALVEMADRARRILMVGHLLEYHPAIDRLR